MNNMNEIMNNHNAALAAALYDHQTGRFNTNRPNVKVNSDGTMFWVDGEPKTFEEMRDYLFEWEVARENEYVVISCNGAEVEHFFFYSDSHTAEHLQNARNCRCVLCELGVPDIHSETRARRVLFGF